MIRDIVELRKSKWVPRRQKEEAKKISEIHAAAHAELGMIPSAVLPGLAPLPAHSRGAVPGLADDVELFPAFKGDGEPQCLHEHASPRCVSKRILPERFRLNLSVQDINAMLVEITCAAHAATLAAEGPYDSQ